MKGKRKLLILVTCFMLFGSALTVNANEPMPCNNWCCAGAADSILDEGIHVHRGETEYHVFKRLKCHGCGMIRQICYR